MNNYKKIDLERLGRKDYFEYFMHSNNLLEVTVKLDVTNMIKKCVK